MSEHDPFPRRARARLSLGSMRRNSVAAVALGGGLGAVIRSQLGSWFAPVTPPAFPWVTLAINLSGAFLLGLIVAVILDVWPPTRYLRPFLAIGLLGGYTTFATFTVETARLLGANETATSLGYISASVLGGLFAVAAGDQVVRGWLRVRRGHR